MSDSSYSRASSPFSDSSSDLSSDAEQLLNPFWVSFTDVTKLVDTLCATYFQSFIKTIHGASPPLSGVQISRMQTISRMIGQYDRSVAFQSRGTLPFALVAEAKEAWVLELVIGFGLGKRIYCGWEDVSQDVDVHLNFLRELQRQLGLGEDLE